MRARPAALVLLCSLTALGVANAQAAGSTRQVSYTAGAGVTFGNLVGGDFSGSKAAVGFDAVAGVVLGRWQLGIGYDRTNHGHEDTDGDYVISNVYFEPRLIISSPTRRWSPYGVLRLGRAMASYEGVLGITDKASGYIAGIGAGVLMPIANRIEADGAVHYARLSHDYGTGGYSAAEKGGRASVQLGVRIATDR